MISDIAVPAISTNCSGRSPSGSTCWRVLDALDERVLARVAAARARAREIAWAQRAEATGAASGRHGCPTRRDRRAGDRHGRARASEYVRSEWHPDRRRRMELTLPRRPPSSPPLPPRARPLGRGRSRRGLRQSRRTRASSRRRSANSSRHRRLTSLASCPAAQPGGALDRPPALRPLLGPGPQPGDGVTVDLEPDRGTDIVAGLHGDRGQRALVGVDPAGDHGLPSVAGDGELRDGQPDFRSDHASVEPRRGRATASGTLCVSQPGGGKKRPSQPTVALGTLWAADPAPVTNDRPTGTAATPRCATGH